MENSNKRKWQIRAGVVAVFLLGFLAGALALNVYQKRREPSFRGMRPDRFEQMLNRLDLTETQRTEVDKIMKETRARMIEIRKQSQPLISDVRKETDQRLQSVLTPQQWQQWQQMKSEIRSYPTRRRGR